MSLDLVKVTGQVMAELDSSISSKKKYVGNGGLSFFLATQQLNPFAYVLKIPLPTPCTPFGGLLLLSLLKWKMPLLFLASPKLGDRL